MRVLAAMSGGVDSAVAAARCVEAGHDVVGVHLALSRSPQTLRTGSRGCCSREDSHDARRAADVLGIPFYVWDFADRFKQDIIDDFIASYESGLTPNPCVRCNEKIKFQALAERAYALGFDAVATGHYARLDNGVLRRAVDATKDQSYVLASLTPEQLRRSLFPLGDTVKDDVRLEAARRGLSVAHKPDSYDICFIPSGDTRAFLGATIGVRSGDVVDQVTGQRVATHEGTYGFTIGQRKGLGTLGPAQDGKPRYVTHIDPVSNTVVIGSKEDLQVHSMVVNPVTVHQNISAEVEYEIQVRSHGGFSRGTVILEQESMIITLTEPLSAVAAGQTAVVYSKDEQLGDVVLAAGTISSVTSRAEFTANAALEYSS